MESKESMLADDNKPEPDDLSLRSEDSHQERERFTCCSLLTVWPWKRLTKPRCKRLMSDTPSSHYRKFSADHDVATEGFLDPVEETSASSRVSPLHGKLLKKRIRSFDDGTPTATRTPYTSNKSKQKNRIQKSSSRHRSLGSLSSDQLSTHIEQFNEFQSDAESGLSIDLRGLEKMANWR